MFAPHNVLSTLFFLIHQGITYSSLFFSPFIIIILIINVSCSCVSDISPDKCKRHKANDGKYQDANVKMLSCAIFLSVLKLFFIFLFMFIEITEGMRTFAKALSCKELSVHLLSQLSIIHLPDNICFLDNKNFGSVLFVRKAYKDLWNIITMKHPDHDYRQSRNRENLFQSVSLIHASCLWQNSDFSDESR